MLSRPVSDSLNSEIVCSGDCVGAETAQEEGNIGAVVGFIEVVRHSDAVVDRD